MLGVKKKISMAIKTFAVK